MNPLAFTRRSPAESLARAIDLHRDLATRRTIRDFSPDPLPAGVLHSCLAAAHTAPSGANLQPWHFAVVTSASMKRRIREAAEAEEREFYESRAPEDWLDTLKPLGTTWRKPFLETAPALIAIFQKNRITLPDGRKSAARGMPTRKNGVLPSSMSPRY
jgi:nitroreductase